MKRLILIVASLCLAMGLAAIPAGAQAGGILLALSQAPAPPQTPSAKGGDFSPVSVPIELSHRFGLILLRAEVNGRPATLVIDTGCSHTILSTKLINSLETTLDPGCMRPSPALLNVLASYAQEASPLVAHASSSKLLARAATGDADAQFDLGYLYETGAGVPQNFRLAADYYQAAADRGHTTAANNLASLYEHGQGVDKSVDKAVQWYLQAAEHGNPIGQCNLASLYFSGRGIRRDYGKALKWFHAAAENGLPAAQNNLAYMLYNGIGVPRDYARAAEWTRRAAETGYAMAQTDLGFLYEQGKGVPLDYTLAYMWYMLGARGGDSRSLEKMTSLSRLMVQKQVSEAIGRANAWMPGH